MCPYTAVIIILIILLLCSQCLQTKTKHLKSPSSYPDTYRVYYFYRDGCGWCDKFNPEFDNFASQTSLTCQKIDTPDLKNKKMVHLANKAWGMKGTPFVVFANHHTKEYNVYDGPRTAAALLEYSKRFAPPTTANASTANPIAEPLFTPDHDVLSS